MRSKLAVAQPGARRHHLTAFEGGALHASGYAMTCCAVRIGSTLK